ncbi:MAG: right-handed parallel beta-helix repeat-containing protein [Candidatus Caldatribacteriota bacterium]|nr:right-handed parallel beta-helix repeat-containing protein [Candidatus Caldatribacteriota bacterium]
MKKLFVLLIVLTVMIFIGGCQNLGEFFSFFNEAPIIISEPVKTATEGNLYSYQVEASDPDGDVLSYFLNLFPEEMNISSENGLVSWLPTNNQIGIHRVIIEVSDGRKSALQDFEIEVSNTNDSPQILSYYPANLNVDINEGDSIRFEIQAEDVDLNTTLNYRWFLNGSLVSNSSVTPVSGSSFVNSWKYFTGVGNSGQKTLKAIISDGELSDSVQWKITVNDITSPNKPTLDAVTSPTNISSQILSGTKESNSGIWINGTEVVALNPSTTWSFSFNLSEGENDISITSKDGAGNESSTVTADIVLDSMAPGVPTLNEVITPTNISPQTLSGTKEENSSIWINGVEAVPINPETIWLYSFDLSEGINNISITSRDALGNESSAITSTIKYDLDIYVDAKNVSGIEDGTETHPFDTIAEGIEAAVSGKSVIVAAETYNEQLVINKGITLRGESRNNTFVTGTGFTGNLITITADNVTISGFLINGLNSTEIGIYIDNYFSITIENNFIKNNKDYGINYCNSNPTIQNNTIEGDGSSGIDVKSGGFGIIRGNSITNNKYGIRTCGDSSPEINNNEITGNSNSGIYCRESATPVISYNTISNNSYGVLIDYNFTWGALVNPDIGGGDRGSEGNNNISGNSIHGVSNKTTHNIYAKYNWWGDAAGPKYPYHVSSSGDWVYWSETGGNVVFEPYLEAEP